MPSTPLPLTVADLKTAAETLEKQAKNLRDLAETIEKRHDLKKNTESRFSALDHYALELCKTINFDKERLDSDIIATASRETGIQPETLEYHARQKIKDRQNRDRLARDREIVRLARRGLTNKEIAAQVDCSTRTVSKAITAAFRQPKTA